ncbi:YbbR-like domain-containing protein [Bacillus sp. CMF21]|uniref:CdaR family protein n=1 Tax=Metabacillus dongyingensis TaxID=2874282 RepID=UPI001CBC3C2D|nr:CdaR family protein [Metabacillus dongyingensis]UAL52489.1 YbbR-like domain-containing protein [Metabacillus dongyingensis]USK28799.1 YbbR-like domain-containing protein [Bacillus sp. CMF21]
MDKMINNHWVMRIIALLMALILYVSVNFETPAPKKQPGPVTSVFPSAPSESAKDTETIPDVEVKTYLDQEDVIVTGVPETVAVTLSGPTNSLLKAKQLKDFEIYAELSDLSIGSHRVQLKHKNIADNLEVNLNPSIITVNVEEKVTRDFPVQVDFINKDQIETGYTAQDPIVKPSVVRVTGSKTLIDSIAMIKSRVNLQNANETIEQESKVTVYDDDGNILPLEVYPSVVDVTVPITSPSKKLPFKLKNEGELGEGLSISNIEAVPNEVTIYGPLDVIDPLEFIDGVTVDLSKIKDDTVLDVDIPVPDGVTKVSPEKIQIKVDVEKEEEKILENLPVNIRGLGEGKIIQFLEPESEELDLSVVGAPSVLTNIKPSDLELFVNVTDLSDGEHDVKVEVNGPQDIKWTLPVDKVKVKISSKQS